MSWLKKGLSIIAQGWKENKDMQLICYAALAMFLGWFYC